MWQERQAKLLRSELGTVLAPLSDVSGLYDLLEEPLVKTRRGLSIESAHDRPWPLLPLMVCEAISGHYENVLPAAAALQLFMAAGDVFDDIEDADSPESLSSRYGSAMATNVATTLLILGENAIVRLKGKGVKDYIIVRIMDTINSYYTTVCAGQHLDLSLTSKISISEDIYIKVSDMKSAAQIQCACHIGALLATNNEELIDTFAEFGHNLGIAAQITNDIHGIICGNDIVKRKITLPVIFAIAQTNGKTSNYLKSAFNQYPKSMADPMTIRDFLFRSGAIHYAMIKKEFYKQRALDILFEAKEAGANVERLNLFLE